MGRISNNFTQKQLTDIMSYNPDTGIAYWKRKEINTIEDYIFNVKFEDKPVGSVDKQGYIVTKINNLSYRVHRIVFYIHHGIEPKCIDHINGDPADNRIVNLRSVTNSENQRNRKCTARGKSGIVGVHQDERYGSWVASISVDKKRYHLGSFSTMLEAKEARQLAEKKHGFTQR